MGSIDNIVNLTPSQLETLRETGSVRVVVKMEPQPYTHEGPCVTTVVWPTVFGEAHYAVGETPRPKDIDSTLPSPGTIETIDWMDCEWVERGCGRFWEVVQDHWKELGLTKLPDKIDDEDTWVWTAMLRRKDDDGQQED